MSTDDLVSVLKEIATALQEKNSPKEKEIKRGDVSIGKLLKETGKGFGAGGIKGAASAFGKFAKGLSPVTIGLTAVTLAATGLKKGLNSAAENSKKTALALATLGEDARKANKNMSSFSESISNFKYKFSTLFDGLSNAFSKLSTLIFRITGNSGEATSRGISDATNTNIKAGLVSSYYNSGYNQKSAEALSNARMSVYDVIYNSSRNGQTYQEIADTFNSNASAYGFAGSSSAAFDYYLANEKGAYRDYLNDAQLAGYLEEFYLKQAELYRVGGSKFLADSVEQWTELGNAIKQAGDNLYSFDEVITNQAKDTTIKDYSFDTVKNKLASVNNIKELEAYEKALDKYNEALEVISSRDKVKIALWLVANDTTGTLKFEDALIQAAELVEYAELYGDAVATSTMILATNEHLSFKDALDLAREAEKEFGAEGLKEYTLRIITEHINRYLTENLNGNGQTDRENATVIAGAMNNSGFLGTLSTYSSILNPNSSEYTNDKLRTYIGQALTNAYGNGASAKQIADFLSSYGSNLATINSSGWVTKKLASLGGTQSEIDTINKYLHDAGIPGYASGGIVGTDQIARIGEGNKKEAVIPLESQSGINFLSQALEQAGGAKTEVNVTLSGQILEMNDYNVRKLGNKLASIIDNETIRRG